MGKLPPTPKDQSAAKTPTAAKLGLDAASIPNTAVMPKESAVSTNSPRCPSAASERH